MAKIFRADLHVHTCLSPCGELDMSPRRAVEAAQAAGLDIIAVCDHNSAENTAAAGRAALKAGGSPHVLSGLEICTAEEVHVLAIFDTPSQALDMQTLVYEHLPDSRNRPDIFGDQVVVNEDDEVEGFSDRLLISSIDLDIGSVVEAVRRRGGLAVASHIDRPLYGLLGQLGFVPPGLAADALEISRFTDPEELLARRPELSAWPFLRNSDAHAPGEVGRAWSEFLLMEPGVGEISLALRQKDGRRVIRLSQRY